MKKSLFVFLAGTAFGMVGTTLLVTSNTFSKNTQNLSRAGSTPATPHQADTSLEAEFDRIDSIAETLNTIANNLQQSANTLSSTSITAVTTNSTQDNTKPLTSQLILPPSTTSIAPPPPEPVTPTATQVDQYTSIQSRLYDAANNHSIALADLIQEADKLTPEQRQELTQEAMDMIQRGELKAEQFTRQPGT